MPRSPWWIATLLRLYPRGYRAPHGGELARAMHACFERERIAGASPILTVLHIAADAVASSLLVRRDLRRAQRAKYVALSTKHSALSTQH